MLKHSIIILTLVSVVGIMTSCTQNDEEKPAITTQAQPQHTGKIAQTAPNNGEDDLTEAIEIELSKTNYTNNAVSINYPQITNLPDSTKQEEINELIRTESMKGMNYYPDTQDLSLEIDYTIALKNTNILSIQYSGAGYVTNAAHPNHLFYTTNINMDKAARVRLNDIVDIDGDLIEYFKSGSLKPLIPEHQYILTDRSTEEILQQFTNADSMDSIGTENQSETFSYFTEDALGISFGGIGFAAGNHAEFEINYHDVPDTNITDEEIWQMLKNK